MCGIIGSLGDTSLDLEIGMKRLAHRGPDASGVYRDAGVQLGHLRLSIIDLSEGANQPMVDAPSGVVIVYNGECYNFRELRRELESAGIRFKTKSDTEVILNGYVFGGPQWLSKINGMFAFAIWDPRNRKLLLGRDPFGIKPLFIRVETNGISFASEPKGLIFPNEGLRVNRQALANYLGYHFPANFETLVANVEPIRPGTISIFDENLERTRVDIKAPAKHSTPSERWLERELEEAVKRQLIADVPVGSFLSSGIDSSIVTALAAKHSEKQISTFTAGWTHDSGELEQARQTAELLGTNHHELTIGPNDAMPLLGKMGWHFDGPVGEAGCIPNWFLALEAKKKVKVVLAGEGADEIHGGYPWHIQQTKRRGSWSRFKMAAWQAKKQRSPSALAAWLSEVAHAAQPYEYQSARAVQKIASVRPKINWPTNSADPRQRDVDVLLKDAYLPKADRMTMAHSIEQRVPMLDLQLAPPVLNWNYREMLRGENKKYLRATARNLLPPQTIRRPKQGFGVPWTKWYEEVGVNDLQSRISGIYGGGERFNITVETRHRRASKVGWLLLALQEWMKESEARLQN